MFYITQKNWDRILGYAEEAYEKHKSEIGGMSVMVKDDQDDWELQFPVILEQEISSGNTILDKEALAVYYTKQAKKMGKKDFRFCWWHSHHTMSAFWSSTDITAIEEYDDGDFSFALVVNLKGEYKFRVSVWQPVEAHQDVDLQVLRPARCTKGMSKEVENLCAKRVTTYPKRSYTSYGYGNIDRKENSSQERLPLRSMTHYSTLYDDDIDSKMTFSEIVEEVDDVNGEAISGSIKYQEYKQTIDDLNTKLKKENSFYKVTLITESRFSQLFHMWPNQMVVYEASDQQVYDDSFYGAF